ncbi:unnamed protein product [Dicrocoelium dendriticum]|nr:unnamed protein product [Dicrocoelium dendriticum]
MPPTFKTLASKANLGARYVNDYTRYLIQDVIKESEVPLGTEQETFAAIGSDVLTISTYSDDNFHGRADQLWLVGRIATLRLVAMHRAASALQERLKPPFPSDSYRISLAISTSAISLFTSIPWGVSLG